MIPALIIAGVALAGMPPPDAIPWDSVLVQDTLYIAGDTIVTDGYWCYYITRDKYEAEVMGWRSQRDVKSIKKDLEAIKAILKESEP